MFTGTSRRWISFCTFLIVLMRTQVRSKEVEDENVDVGDYANDESNVNFLISGGFRPAKHTLAKYVVSIRTARHTAYFGDNHFCAGAIIAKKVIITAAHCVVDSNKITTRAKRLKVVAGAPNRLFHAATAVEMEVDTVIPHEHFTREGLHDIALLRLKVAIPIDNDAVKIISLGLNTPITNTNCTTIGWGQLFSDGPYSADAVYVQMTILKPEHCKKHYERFSNGMLCAADPRDWDRDACPGDSGGPLFCNGRLAGIVSFTGISCAVKDFPTIFTDVSQYRRWIQDVSGVQKCAISSIFIVVLCILLTCIF